MFTKRRLMAALMAASMLATLTACGGDSGGADTGDSSTADSGQTGDAGEPADGGAIKTVADLKPAEADMTEWEKSSGIWNWDETEDELYEKAKEEGKVVLYSISSRCPKVAEAFQEAYPGVVCEPFDISTNELLEKVTREYDAGIHNADVVHIKDQDGSLWEEYVKEKKFYCYQPTDIMSHIDPSLSATSTPLYIELTQLFYNTESNPDGSPIKSLWDLTKPEWKGRITMQNPIDNLSWSSWITGFTLEETAQKLETEYKEVFGEDIVLSDGCENAGYEFLKRLHDNQPVFCSSSDECAESVGTKGQANPPVGFSASSKLRKNKDNDWVLSPVNLTPNTGIPAINTLYIVEGSEHPNAAKLLVRFMMGGTDGSSKGYTPFNTLGGWPVRDDIEPAEGSTPYKEINVAGFDPTAIYENIGIVTDFWTMLEQ